MRRPIGCDNLAARREVYVSQDQLILHNKRDPYLEYLQHVAARRWIFDELAEEIDVRELHQENILKTTVFCHLYKQARVREKETNEYQR